MVGWGAACLHHSQFTHVAFSQHWDPIWVLFSPGWRRTARRQARLAQLGGGMPSACGLLVKRFVHGVLTGLRSARDPKLGRTR